VYSFTQICNAANIMTYDVSSTAFEVKRLSRINNRRPSSLQKSTMVPWILFLWIDVYNFDLLVVINLKKQKHWEL